MKKGNYLKPGDEVDVLGSAYTVEWLKYDKIRKELSAGISGSLKMLDILLREGEWVVWFIGDHIKVKIQRQ